jgi:hypothetical protein
MTPPLILLPPLPPLRLRLPLPCLPRRRRRITTTTAACCTCCPTAFIRARRFCRKCGPCGCARWRRDRCTRHWHSRYTGSIFRGSIFRGLGFSEAWGFQRLGVFSGFGFSVVWGFQWFGVFSGLGFSVILGFQWFWVFRGRVDKSGNQTASFFLQQSICSSCTQFFLVLVERTLTAFVFQCAYIWNLEGESIRAAVRHRLFCGQFICFLGQSRYFLCPFSCFHATRGESCFFLTDPDSFSPH